MTKIDAINGILGATGIHVQGDADQIAAWTLAAGGEPVGTWLAEVADAAASGGAERTWPARIKLRHPIEFGREHITDLEFRRGKAGDIKGMQLSDKVPTDQLFLIASRMCGQPVKVIEMLDVDDAAEVMGIALVFYGKCLGGGRMR